MGIKFIHLSDTHLGASDMDIVDANGVNVREQDIYDAFKRCVDKIIEEKPDFVLHTGDIFHRSSPSNRSIVEAAAQIRRVTEHGIKFYMIAGNHDFPKSSFTSPIHDLFKLVDECRIIFDEKYEVLDEGNYILHMLPHINSENDFIEEAKKIKVSDNSRPNILLMHLSLPSYLMNEYGERVFPDENTGCLKDFDYVALGHWHRFQQLEKYGNVYYAGSIEAVNEKEAGIEKCMVKVEIENGNTVVEPLTVKNRVYKVIQIENVFQKDISTVMTEISDAVKDIEIEGGIFKVVLNNVSPSQYSEFPKDVIIDFFETSLKCTVVKTLTGDETKIEYEADTFDLRMYLSEELKKSFSDESEYSKMNSVASRILDEIEEAEANAD